MNKDLKTLTVVDETLDGSLIIKDEDGGYYEASSDRIKRLVDLSSAELILFAMMFGSGVKTSSGHDIINGECINLDKQKQLEHKE